MSQRRRTQYILPMGLAMVFVLVLGGLVLARGTRSPAPCVLIDTAKSPALSSDSGVVRLKEALLEAIRPEGAGRLRTGVDPRFKQALEAQAAYLQRASKSVLDGNSAALQSQLQEIRRELDAEVLRQMELYRESLDAHAQAKLRSIRAERAEELQRFRRSLEAQYAATILNLKLGYQAAGHAERQDIDRELALIHDEIERQILERETSNRQGLAELQVSIDREVAEETDIRRRELMDWAEREYRRAEIAQREYLTRQNADLMDAIQQGVRTRTGELHAKTGGR